MEVCALILILRFFLNFSFLPSNEEVSYFCLFEHRDSLLFFLCPPILCLRIHRPRSTPTMNKNRIPQIESHMIDVQPESFLLFPEMEISSTAELWVNAMGKVTRSHSRANQIPLLTVTPKFYVGTCGPIIIQKFHRAICSSLTTPEP